MIAGFLVVLLLLGLFVLTYDWMEDIYKALGYLLRAAIDSFKGVELTDRSELWERVRVVLGITLNMGTDRAVRLFFGISGALSFGSMVILGGRVSLWMNAIASVMMFFAPYMLLRFRMERIRIRSSLEGEILLSELTENYKIYYYNMKEGIDRTALTIEDAPDSKRILQNLSLGLQRAGSERSITRLLEEFALSINTSWAGTLKNLMYFSLVHGIRVDEALEDLSATLRRAREVKEFARRENNESRLMLKYMIPLGYGLTVLAGVRYFGLGWEKFWHYQFQTEAGMTWITASLIVYAISYMVNLYLSESKLDL
ncbi:MAG: hypothetical protein J6Q41_00885 [Firmicutes bacterium]|nr:hypothetical protein [Bacillota bacterium]